MTLCAPIGGTFTLKAGPHEVTLPFDATEDQKQVALMEIVDKAGAGCLFEPWFLARLMADKEMGASGGEG